MNDLTLSTDGTSTGFVVTIAGKLGGVENERFEKELFRLAELKPARITLDMSELTYMSSAGMSTIIRVHKQLRESSGELVLAAVPPLIQGILHAGGIDRLVSLVDQPEQPILPTAVRSRHECRPTTRSAR